MHHYCLLLSVTIENVTRFFSLWYKGSARFLWKKVRDRIYFSLDSGLSGPIPRLCREIRNGWQPYVHKIAQPVPTLMISISPQRLINLSCSQDISLPSSIHHSKYSAIIKYVAGESEVHTGSDYGKSQCFAFKRFLWRCLKLNRSIVIWQWIPDRKKH